LGSIGLAPPVLGAEPSAAQALFDGGKYSECIEMAREGIESQSWRETWWDFKLRAELETGQYAAALETLQEALEAFSSSVKLRLIGHRIHLLNNQPEEAEARLVEIEALVVRQRWRFNDSASRIVLGRFFLLRGADPRQVLETFYDPVKREMPSYADTYLAVGDLALQKHDYELAAESFTHAAKLLPENPEAHFGLARAFATSDSERSLEALARALELNPRFTDGLLFQVDRLIDSEQYQKAGAALDGVLAVNRRHPLALAYRAVLANLECDAKAEESWRAAALDSWSTNPEVDHLIGRKLAEKYRFAEGAACQRKALAFDPGYLPAKLQLSRDLLSLGLEEEAWRLADEVFEKDSYNVAAHNLVALHQSLSTYKTLKAEGFELRMDGREAEVYGRNVLRLLGEAREVLTEKYAVDLKGPIVVEIFRDRQDFAVRTFGVPFVEGFLGVCFGRVITANSPASLGDAPANWEAVLWHEFCHSVTLQKTNNRMPRWLSEGISVYEERRRDPSWGQSMNAAYRLIILGGGLVPVDRLSGAFLAPPTPEHLQFAYYQSSLVLEYLVETHGMDVLRTILDDLAGGASINGVLESHVGPLDEFNLGFVEYAEKQAREFAPDVDWDSPDPPAEADAAALTAWNDAHPNSLAGLLQWAQRLADAGQWEEAKIPLERILRIYSGAGAEAPYLLLAKADRELGDAAAERDVLEKLARINSAAVEVYLRLMELCEAAEDWGGLASNAERLVAVNPMLRSAHRNLGRAAEKLGDSDRAIAAYRSLLELDPIDPVEAHFRLARLLHAEGQTALARRHVLQALEEAPRYRAARELLLEIVDRPEGSDAGGRPNPEKTGVGPGAEGKP
jgi:tetratricopeptide (TPR) repeat protein